MVTLLQPSTRSLRVRADGPTFCMRFSTYNVYKGATSVALFFCLISALFRLATAQIVIYV